MATVRIKCDGCGAIRQALPNQDVGTLRQNVGKAGWRSDMRNDLDFCSLCFLKAREGLISK